MNNLSGISGAVSGYFVVIYGQQVFDQVKEYAPVALEKITATGSELLEKAIPYYQAAINRFSELAPTISNWSAEQIEKATPYFNLGVEKVGEYGQIALEILETAEPLAKVTANQALAFTASVVIVKSILEGVLHNSVSYKSITQLLV